MWKHRKYQRMVKTLSVYNYENQTYRLTFCGVINSATTKQEGILMYLRGINNDRRLKIFINKRDMARLARMTKTGRTFWKPFKLPKMEKQTYGEKIE